MDDDDLSIDVIDGRDMLLAVFLHNDGTVSFRGAIEPAEVPDTLRAIIVLYERQLRLQTTSEKP